MKKTIFYFQYFSEKYSTIVFHSLNSAWCPQISMNSAVNFQASTSLSTIFRFSFRVSQKATTKNSRSKEKKRNIAKKKKGRKREKLKT